jgi:hypothetical protein
MAHNLVCWKCGADLAALTLPLSRRDECARCRAELHVCRMCIDYDEHVAKKCREPIAEEVNDKTQANFCDYFAPRPAPAPSSPGSSAASPSPLLRACRVTRLPIFGFTGRIHSLCYSSNRASRGTALERCSKGMIRQHIMFNCWPAITDLAPHRKPRDRPWKS